MLLRTAFLWKILCLSGCIGLLLSGCQPDKQGPACPIQVGIITSLTGSSKAGGEEHLRGYEIALDEINAAGGVLGCPVELAVIDDQSLPTEAQMAVKHLAADDRIWVISGSFTSDATVPAVGVANVYQVSFLVPTASSDLITTQGYSWVFRVNSPGSAYANTALDFIQENLGTSAILAIIYEATLYGESGAVALATGAEERGFKIAAYESYIPGKVDYPGLLNRVKAANPDVVYFVSNNGNESAEFMKQSAAIDLNPKLFIGHAGGFVVPSFLNAGPFVEGVIATAQWAMDVKWTGASAFTQKFKQRFDIDPGMRSAQTYASLYIAIDAIRRAGADPDLDWNDTRKIRMAVRDALRDTNLPDTIFGQVKFDRTGQNDHPILLTQVIDGEYVSVYPATYKAEDPVVPLPVWAERIPKQ